MRSLFLLSLLFLQSCDPHKGQSSAYEQPLVDGSVVLLRRNNERAAIIITNQSPHFTEKRAAPGSLKYTWYYRSDGKGTFSGDDTNVSSGVVENATSISFASLSIDWSAHSAGQGWIYYSRLPTKLGTGADFQMCVVGPTNVSFLNANDPIWEYRSRPSIRWGRLIAPE